MLDLCPVRSAQFDAASGTLAVAAEQDKTHRRADFDPRTLSWCVNNLFREWNNANPGRKITPHDLRRRAITLTVMATGGNVGATAQAIGIDPDTARRHYLDSRRAFDSEELLRKMASVYVPRPILVQILAQQVRFDPSS